MEHKTDCKDRKKKKKENFLHLTQVETRLVSLSVIFGSLRISGRELKKADVHFILLLCLHLHLSALFSNSPSGLHLLKTGGSQTNLRQKLCTKPHVDLFIHRLIVCDTLVNLINLKNSWN